MARPVTDKTRPETRMRILESAQEEFARLGFEAARLEDVGSRAGIRRASLFHYFDSKKALYEAAVRDSFSQLARRLQAVFSGKHTAREAVDNLVTEYWAFARERPAIQKLILRELLDPAGEGYSIMEREILPLLGGVEAFLRFRGGRALRNGDSLRQAILSWVLSITVRVAMGERAAPVWGERDHSLELAGAMVFK